MRVRISCRNAREELQNLLDCGFVASSAEELLAHLPVEQQAHVRGCARCAQFLQALSGYAPRLRRELDAAMGEYGRSPAPRVEALSRGTRMPMSSAAGPSALSAAAAGLRAWLAGIIRGPAAGYRWAAVSVAGLLLVVLVGVRIYVDHTTNRTIHREIDRIVESVFEEPLLPDIESALLRSQPAVSGYFEDLDQTIDRWDESYLN